MAKLRATAKEAVRIAALALILCALLPVGSRACYSGLVLIPTTDVAGDLQWALDLQWQGYSRVLKTDQFVINTEFGLGDRFEAGVDVDASSGEVDRRVRINAKYIFVKSERWRFALAGGVQNVSSTFTPHPYVVCTKEWDFIMTHLGIQREESGKGTHGFFGVDRTFGEHWQVMADHTAGEENYTSAGIGWSGGRWQMLLGALWPNAGGSPVVVVHVVLTGAFGKK